MFRGQYEKGAQSMVIRNYKATDKDAVTAITKAAWIGVTMAELREKQYGILGGLPWAEQKARTIVAKCEAHPEEVFIAELEGEVAGYATYSVNMNGDVGMVSNNAVAPAFQGRGIGTTLVNHVQKTLVQKGVKMLEVSTFVHDAAARKVYERLGFREVARTVHYQMAPDEVIDYEAQRQSR